MKVNQLKAGSLISYIQMALGFVVSLVYTPFLIRILGAGEYGLYNTAASAVAMLSALNLGFNSSYIRFFTKYKSNGDDDSISRLNGLFLVIFSIMGAAALLCGLAMSFGVRFIFDRGLSDAELHTARILLLLLSVNLAVSFPMSVFSNIIAANERFVFLKLLGLLRTVVSPVLTLPLLLIGYRSVALAAVTVAVSFVTDVCYSYYVFAVLKNRFKFGGLGRGIFKSLFGFTSFIAVNIFIDQINWNLGKIILGRFFGTEMVAVYSAGYTLYTYYQLFSTSISGVFTPKIHNIVAGSESIGKRNLLLTDLFIRVGRIQFLVLAPVAAGMIFFGQSFVNYWAGEGYEDSYYVALLFILSSTVALIQNIGIEIQRAQNKHRFRSVAYAVMAVINLTVTIWLCRLYGAVGTAVGTSLSLIIANGFVMNIYYHKKCGINIIEFWKNIARLSVGLIAPAVLGAFLLIYFKPSDFFGLMTQIALFSAVYVTSMWFFGMNNYEKGLLKMPFRRFFKGAQT